MERKRGIEQSIIAEFDLITPYIEDMWNTGIDYVIDTRVVRYFPISVIPIGWVAESYPTIRKRLAEEYFLPKMSLFFNKWKEYLYEKLESLEATKPEVLGHIRGYQVNVGYDRNKECFVLVFSKREFY
jgi:hypothetical protein